MICCLELGRSRPFSSAVDTEEGGILRLGTDNISSGERGWRNSQPDVSQDRNQEGFSAAVRGCHAELIVYTKVEGRARSISVIFLFHSAQASLHIPNLLEIVQYCTKYTSGIELH